MNRKRFRNLIRFFQLVSADRVKCGFSHRVAFELISSNLGKGHHIIWIILEDFCN